MAGLANSGLMQSYYAYAAILVLKFLTFTPLAAVVNNPEKIQRANISDLKNLTPFWLMAPLYMNTAPDRATALALVRLFVLARFVTALGYVQKIPKMARELAFFVSFAITTFMGGWVLFTYRKSL